MKIILMSLLLIFSTNLYSQETTQELKPFATDYCSRWPEGTPDNKNLWADCCFTHDLHYWIGGTEEERKASDKELKTCVKLSGASIASFLMYMGVRMGGKPGDADYAWGFGWKTTRGYEKIPPEDVMLAKTLLESSEYNNEEWMKNLINEFISTTLSSRMQE